MYSSKSTMYMPNFVLDFKFCLCYLSIIKEKVVLIHILSTTSVVFRFSLKSDKRRKSLKVLGRINDDVGFFPSLNFIVASGQGCYSTFLRKGNRIFRTFILRVV